MAMSLPPGEPAAGPWRVVPLDELVRLLLEATAAAAGRPRVVAVDGRSAGGKSTIAQRLSRAVPASTVVHTDDVAWHHSSSDWAELLGEGVLEPLRRGEAVAWRPPGWQRKGRAGAIEVPAGLDLVLVEGVGAGRRELEHLVDAVVWVQSDSAEAERRGLARDLACGVNGDEAQTVPSGTSGWPRSWRSWRSSGPGIGRAWSSQARRRCPPVRTR